MYARTTTVRGDPEAVEAGIGYARDTVWPMLEGMSGCVGMSMLADQESGQSIVTAAWASEEAMRASAEMVRDSRRQLAEVLRADTVDVAEWEIATLHRMHAAGDGACARVIWIDCPADQMERTVDAWRMTMVARVEELPGFCSLSMMIDRAMGRLVLTTTYSDHGAMARARERAMALRTEFAQSMGVTVTDVAEFDVAVAHLRVPEMA